MVRLGYREASPPFSFLDEAKREADADLAKMENIALLERFHYWVRRTLFDFARYSLKPTVFTALAMGNLERALTRGLQRQPGVTLAVAAGSVAGGEEGDILNPAMDQPGVREHLAEIRRQELDRAARIIGYDEVVMLGGHLDSWTSATGATDNAIGCAIMMEAARIIQSLGLKPSSTTRILSSRSPSLTRRRCTTSAASPGGASRRFYSASA